MELRKRMNFGKRLLFVVLAIMMMAVGVTAAASLQNNVTQDNTLQDNTIHDREGVEEYVRPENFVPMTEELDPKTADVRISMDQAIEAIQGLWSVPDADVRGLLFRDRFKVGTFWWLDWGTDNVWVLHALVDADTGEVVAILDFRYEGKEDNLKDTARAVDIGLEMLKKLGVDVNQLMEPKVGIPPSQQITYSVIWYQVHEGLRVLDGYVVVDIDSETLKPVGFAKWLISTEGIDTKSSVPVDTATSIAKDFIETKGYSVRELINVELVIGRSNYFWEGTPKERGEPTLLWQVTLETDLGGIALEHPSLLGGGKGNTKVWINAHTGEVVGGDQIL